jgi:hypothetical protein
VQVSVYVGELVSVGDGVTVGMYVVTVVGCEERTVVGVVVGALLLVTLLLVAFICGTRVEFLSGTGDVEVSVTVSSHQHDTGKDDDDESVVLRTLDEVYVAVTNRVWTS